MTGGAEGDALRGFLRIWPACVVGAHQARHVDQQRWRRALSGERTEVAAHASCFAFALMRCSSCCRLQFMSIP